MSYSNKACELRIYDFLFIDAKLICFMFIWQKSAWFEIKSGPTVPQKNMEQ